MRGLSVICSTAPFRSPIPIPQSISMCGTVLDDWMQPIKHCFEPIKNDLVIKRAVALSPSVSWGRRQIQAGRKPVYSYFFERNIPGVDSSSGKTGPYHDGDSNFIHHLSFQKSHITFPLNDSELSAVTFLFFCSRIILISRWHPAAFSGTASSLPQAI